LYATGGKKGLSPDGKVIKEGFSEEDVEKVLAEGGRLPLDELLRCRVRYFSDGLVLGSKEYVNGVFRKYRGRFGVKRKTGAREMRHGDWGGVCTMRDLRVQVISRAPP
jgi:putative transposase